MKDTLETINFCTLFDINYLSRALALYKSIARTTQRFHLWMLCLDNESAILVRELNLLGVTVIELREIEEESLLSLKPTRSPTEYCWTLTPFLPMYILNKYQDVDHIIYADADTYFFRDPVALFQEIGEGSVLIFEHNFPPRRQSHAALVGRFNVGVIVFKRTTQTMSCLSWWRNRCVEWCFARTEPGLMGDQVYLDLWPSLFSKVVIGSPKNPALAPWNLESYKYSIKSGTLYCNGESVLFYHFSKLTILSKASIHYCLGYWVPFKVGKMVYVPYLEDLKNIYQELEALHPGFFAGIQNVSLRKKSINLIQVIVDRLTQCFCRK